MIFTCLLWVKLRSPRSRVADCESREWRFERWARSADIMRWGQWIHGVRGHLCPVSRQWWLMTAPAYLSAKLPSFLSQSSSFMSSWSDGNTDKEGDSGILHDDGLITKCCVWIFWYQRKCLQVHYETVQSVQSYKKVSSGVPLPAWNAFRPYFIATQSTSTQSCHK